jgi:hypothetical protein
MRDLDRWKASEENLKLSGKALSDRVADLRERARSATPEVLAHKTGTEFLVSGGGEGDFVFSMFGKGIQLEYPSLIARTSNGMELPTFVQALVLYYFTASTGDALTGKWVSFADLPGGRVYSKAFQEYSGDKVTSSIGQDINKFLGMCRREGGIGIDMADAAFLFHGFPRMPLILAYWLGEDDFPSTCKVLFDSAACAYLPIDGCAIIGSQLIKNILK